MLTGTPDFLGAKDHIADYEGQPQHANADKRENFEDPCTFGDPCGGPYDPCHDAEDSHDENPVVTEKHGLGSCLELGPLILELHVSPVRSGLSELPFASAGGPWATLAAEPLPSGTRVRLGDG